MVKSVGNVLNDIGLKPTDTDIYSNEHHQKNVPVAERILKSSISVLDSFNDVRNNRSLAHDNPVLNRNESLLIFQHVTNIIRFIWTIDQDHQ